MLCKFKKKNKYDCSMGRGGRVDGLTSLEGKGFTKVLAPGLILTKDCSKHNTLD